MIAYKDPDSSLLIREAAALYHCSKNSIANHLNDTSKYDYTPNIYIERQKLSPAEKETLIIYILNYYELVLGCDGSTPVRGAPYEPLGVFWNSRELRLSHKSDDRIIQIDVVALKWMIKSLMKNFHLPTDTLRIISTPFLSRLND